MHNSISRPYLIENSKQIQNLISQTNKRLVISDYNEEDLSINQDGAINQLFYLIDNFVGNKKNSFDIIDNHSYGKESYYNLSNELRTTKNFNYTIKNLGRGTSWTNADQIREVLEPGDNLDYYSNQNLEHHENKRINPLFLHGISYDYFTYWPYPEYLFDQFMHKNTKQKNYLDDIYYPKKEEFILKRKNTSDELIKFDPEKSFIYKLTPVLLKYAVFILSSSSNIDLIAVNNKLQKIISKDLDGIFNGTEFEENYFTIFGYEYSGTYLEVLKKVQEDKNVPKNYLEPNDFKLVYGKSKSFAESYAIFIEKETGNKVKVVISEDEKIKDKTFDEAKK